MQTLAGAVCPECGKMFFVGTDDPEDATYACPHCAKSVTPQPLTPENAPIASPNNSQDETGMNLHAGFIISFDK